MFENNRIGAQIRIWIHYRFFHDYFDGWLINSTSSSSNRPMWAPRLRTLHPLLASPAMHEQAVTLHSRTRYPLYALFLVRAGKVLLIHSRVLYPNKVVLLKLPVKIFVRVQIESALDASKISTTAKPEKSKVQWENLYCCIAKDPIIREKY